MSGPEARAVRFPSAEWADAYRIALNAEPEYAEAAAAWEGDLLLLVRPDDSAPHGEGIYLDLFHGSCRSARYLADPRNEHPEFTYEGARADWTRLFRRELDPVKAILQGTFRIQGNLAKAMRYTRAAKVLVDTASRVPTEP